MARIITEPICKTGERTLVPWRHGHKNKRHRRLMSVEIISRVNHQNLSEQQQPAYPGLKLQAAHICWKNILNKLRSHYVHTVKYYIFSNDCHYMSIHPFITRQQTPKSSVDCYQPICKKMAFTDVSGWCLSDMCHRFLRSHIHELLARDIPAAICV